MKHLPKILRLFAISILFGISIPDMCLEQESLPGGTPEAGTLNLLLANKNGFVIAADSRRTRSRDGAHWDDSQKLFRVGPRSALVMAGFASWAAPGSPLDVQVAS